MPTYEYACTSCAHEWETEQSIKDDALKDCPACHAATARRQISKGAGFILKGGGWYADLYSSSSNKGGSEGKSASDGAASAETKASSESKPSTSSSDASSPSTQGSSDKGGGGDKPAPSGTKPAPAAA